MFKRISLLAVLTLVTALVAPVPASANNAPRVGTHLNLFPGLVGPTTLAANTPFFVAHGWGCDDQAAADVATANCLDPRTTFVLSINGVKQQSITDLEVSSGGIVQGKIQVSNFRAGLPAGTYLFEGQWLYDGVVALTSDVYVTFT